MLFVHRGGVRYWRSPIFDVFRIASGKQALFWKREHFGQALDPELYPTGQEFILVFFGHEGACVRCDWPPPTLQLN